MVRNQNISSTFFNRKQTFSVLRMFFSVFIDAFTEIPNCLLSLECPRTHIHLSVMPSNVLTKRKLTTQPNHFQTFFPGKFKQFKCAICDHKSSQKGRIRQHVLTVHKKLKPYQCEFCSYSASIKQSLQVHINTVHKKLKPYKCENCNYTATQNTTLTAHINAVHKKLKPYKCEYCEHSASLKQTLKVHINAERR